MIWPVGQPNGKLYERALQSKRIWKDICKEAGLWKDEVGSLHLAYDELEWEILNETAEAHKHLRPVKTINAKQALNKSPAVNPANLKGALWSEDEMIVEARAAIQAMPLYFSENIQLIFILTPLF